MLSVNNNHRFFRLLQWINDSITAYVLSIYRSTWQNTTLRAQIWVIMVLLFWLFPEKESSWLYQSILRHYMTKIIDCLMGRTVLEGPGCSLHSGWLICSDSAKYISKGTLRVYSVNSPGLFFFSNHYLFNRSKTRSKGRLVNSYQILSHSIKKDGNFSDIVRLAYTHWKMQVIRIKCGPTMPF